MESHTKRFYALLIVSLNNSLIKIEEAEKNG